MNPKNQFFFQNFPDPDFVFTSDWTFIDIDRILCSSLVDAAFLVLFADLQLSASFVGASAMFRVDPFLSEKVACGVVHLATVEDN